MSVATTLSALKENSPQEFEVDGIDVVLVRTDGEVFAVGATCTHAEVPMVDGEVVDCGLECYMHGSFFDLRTCLLYTSPSPRDVEESRMPSSA